MSDEYDQFFMDMSKRVFSKMRDGEIKSHLDLRIEVKKMIDQSKAEITSELNPVEVVAINSYIVGLEWVLFWLLELESKN